MRHMREAFAFDVLEERFHGYGINIMVIHMREMFDDLRSGHRNGLSQDRHFLGG
jgi:hypothetical protein